MGVNEDSAIGKRTAMNTVDVEVTLQSVATVGILTAIAVIMYAIWADYEERSIQDESGKMEDATRALRLRQIRITSLFPMATQLFIFFGSSTVRWAYPVTCLGFFIAAIFIQTQIQQKLEKKLLTLNPKKVSARVSRRFVERRVECSWVANVFY